MSFDPNCCRLDLPYPQVRISRPNTGSAALLSADLAGQVSEMSAIVAYTFQHETVEDAALSNAMSCIANVEMRHFGLIGQLIAGFGGAPRLAVQTGCNCCWWSGQFVCYETDPVRFLRENIRNERAAITNYTTRIAQLSDECAIAVLERIILDEQHHIEIFESFLNEYQGSGGCGCNI